MQIVQKPFKVKINQLLKTRTPEMFLKKLLKSWKCGSFSEAAQRFHELLILYCPIHLSIVLSHRPSNPITPYSLQAWPPAKGPFSPARQSLHNRLRHVRGANWFDKLIKVNNWTEEGIDTVFLMECFSVKLLLDFRLSDRFA